MEIAQIVANQVLVMFLLMAVGVLCERFGALTPMGVKR